MADFHAADLWVAVVPETSQVGPAMEQAGKEAKGKFGDAVKGIGKNIHDEFDKIGDKAKEKFGKAGKTAGDAFNSEIGKELRNTVGEAIEPYVKNAMDEVQKVAVDKAKDVGHGITKSIGDAIGGSFGNIAKELGNSLIEGGVDTVAGRLRDRLSGVKDSVDEVKRSFTQLKNGDLNGVSTALDTIDQKAKDFGVDVTGWTGPLHDVAGGPLNEVQTRTKDIRNQAHDFLDVFKDLPGKIGASATALGALVDGPLAAAVAAALTIDHALHIDSNTFDPGQHGWGHVLFGKTWDWLGGGDPNTGLDKHDLDKSSTPNLPPATPPPGVVPPPNAPGAMGPFVRRPGGVQQPGDLGGLLGGSTPHQATLSDRITPAPGGDGHNFYKDWYSSASDGGGGGDTVPLVQGPNGTWTSPNPSWAHLIQRESGGINQRQKIIDANSGGNEAEGLFQITPATWRAHGGTKFAPNPLAASPQDQARIAAAILKGNPSGSDWGAGISGRESASGLLSGLGAGGPMPAGYNFYKDWYPGDSGDAGSSGGSGSRGGGGGFRSVGSPGGGSSSGGGQIPTGAAHDPLYVTQAGGGASGGGGEGGGSGSPFEGQGQQLGQGLVNGVLEMFGIDGSVFKGFGSGKGLLDFGALKLGSGLLNWGMKMGQSRGAGSGSAGPGMALGGDGASIPGMGLLQGLGGLIPGAQGAAISAGAVPTGGAPGTPAGGPTINIHGDVNSGMNVTQHGVQGSGYQDWKEAYNANSTRTAPLTVPNAGGLPAG